MKKKLLNLIPIQKSGIEKLLMTMKLALIIVFFSVLQVSANVYSQITVTLDVKNESVREVLKTIEQQSQVRFFYSDDLLAMDERIDLKADNENIISVLSDIFSEYPLAFKTYDNNLIVIGPKKLLQDKKISGTVTGVNGSPLPGVNVVVTGTTTGTTTDIDGKFSIEIPQEAVSLTLTFIGMESQVVPIGTLSQINVTMIESAIGLEEVVVVGYGTQKRSDITGTVASMPKDRLENVPNLNIAQAIQGAIPGVMIQTSSAGAVPDEAIMIRGRNSITASNNPLIVVDGIPYSGNISDINPSDVQAIEILKDASASAIYGSRGANGIILITTKEGVIGKNTISYEGKYSRLSYAKLPDLLTGPEYYEFKMERDPLQMSLEEQAVHDSGKWIDWMDLAFRKGFSQEHNLSVSGGFNDTKYYIGGGLMDITGLTINDNFQRISTRINVETKVADWISIGTRTQLTMDDASGASPDLASSDGVFGANPNTTAYDENGKLTVFPWPKKPDGNPLQGILFKDIDKSYQIVSNNYAIINFPFAKGLSYRINTGIRMRFVNQARYKGRDTQEGSEVRGSATTNRYNSINTVIENIFNYNKEFGNNSIFATALFSYEGSKNSSNGLSAVGFPNDFLSWYSSAQAELIMPSYTFDETNLISQMLRLNYSYSSRYLVTMTIRRDGYSGFGTQKKWGMFPSIALGWNLANEDFFPLKNLFSELKVRASYGLNGNQAVGAYETISRLTIENMVSGNTSLPGYKPSVLGQDELGWESSQVLNLGLDFGLLKNRITGNINWYLTNTKDLLLARTISAVHGITSIIQNIGETRNNGLELSISSRNIITNDFQWSTTGNLSFNKNKILSLYGFLDEEGNEVDDIANTWFIGKPIAVNYDFVWDGVWQLDEAAEAATWGSLPGYVKLKDIDGDKSLSGNDRQIIGQTDPKLMWGITNSLSYKNLTLNIFVYGVHGVTKYNELMRDDVFRDIRRNIVKKNWWTPENPTNDFYMNKFEAQYMGGIIGRIYEDASFIRIKDISLSYDIPKSMIGKIGISKLQLFVTGRNLCTFTKWSGLDPELDSQVSYPLQKEYVFGLSLGF